MDNNGAVQYLESLLGQTLRVHTTDTRMFVGTFKCTDAACNIILAGTYEYRFPSPSAVQNKTLELLNPDDGPSSTSAKPNNVKVDMSSRLIGLVVIPGQHITRIEVEETPDQARIRQTLKT